MYAPGALRISQASGLELVLVDNGGSVLTTLTTQQIADLADRVSNNAAITALNTVGAGVITAAGFIGGIVARGGAQSATAFTDTTSTAALIIAALPAGAAVGTTFLWRYENNTDGNATLTGGVGVTVSGNLVVPALTWAEYLVTYSAAGTVTVAFVGGGSVVPLPYAQFSTVALQSSTFQVGTLAGSEVVTAINTGLTPGNLNLPLATEIIAAIPNAKVGLSYSLFIRNAAGGANTATIVTNTGITLTGTMTIAQNVTRQFLVTVNTLTTITIQSIGISAAGA
ncbi:MAG: hypothetical protein WCP82_04585 [Alphaproteobacteria bacterium]